MPTDFFARKNFEINTSGAYFDYDAKSDLPICTYV